MIDCRRYTTTLSITILVTALVLSADVNSYANASAPWVVGSQLSEVAASGNNVYVLWQNNSPDQNVYFRRSADGGATFDRIIRLSDSVSPQYATSPKMAAFENNVYVAWMEGTSSEDSKVVFRKSTDGGATFESPQVISGYAERSSNIQQLFALGNNVYAVMIDYWTDEYGYYYDSTFRLSKDNGKTVGEPISLLPAPSHWNIGGVTSTAISPSGDMFYAVGVDYGDCRPEQVICDEYARIFFKRSADGGSSFSEAITIQRPPGIVAKSTDEIRAQAPAWVQVASDNSRVSIVWGEYLFAEERESIFLSTSNDKGETFGAPYQLDSGAKWSSDWPLLFSSSDSTYVAWNAREDNEGMPYVGLVRLNSDGSLGRLASNIGKINIPTWDVGTSGNSLYVAGSNGTQNGPGLPDGTDVYFAASVDEGDSFGKTIALSDDKTIKTLLAAQQKSLSFVNPMLAVSGSQVYVAWHVAYPDSHELFIRASSDGGRTFGKMTSLNEEVKEPVSRGLAILTSSSAIYAIAIVGAIAAGALGILVIKRRGGIR